MTRVREITRIVRWITASILLFILVYKLARFDFDDWALKRSLEKDAAIIQVFLHEQNWDEKRPWSHGARDESILPAVYLGDSGYLTIWKHSLPPKYAEYSLIGQENKKPIAVKYFDRTIGLLLLAKPAEITESELPNLEIAEAVELEEDATIATANPQRKIDLVDEELTSLIWKEYHFGSSYPMPLFSTRNQSAKREVRGGEAVFQNGALAGIVNDVNDGKVTIMPIDLIRRFLENAVAKQANGFPTFGLELAVISEAEEKEYFGLDPKDKVGVLITYSPSPSDPKIDKRPSFLQNDILLAVNGEPVRDDGMMTTEFGLASVMAALPLLALREDLTFEVMRAKKKIELKVAPLIFNESERVDLYDDAGESPSYAIIGGLVFRHLTRRFLEIFERPWKENVPLHLFHLYTREANYTGRSDERIVVLSDVLADHVNIGQQGEGYPVLKSVNGKEVHSVEDLSAAVSGSKEPFLVFDFMHLGRRVALKASELAVAHTRMAKVYELPDNAAFVAP